MHVDAKEVIQKAIDEIILYDDICTCHIIKSCDTCEIHIDRMQLIKSLEELNSVGRS